LAETTEEPCSSAVRISSRAGSMPADDLHHQVEVATDQALCVCGEQPGVQRSVALAPGSPHRDAGELEPGTHARLQLVGLLDQDARHL
jgi:hypothetical protein